MEFGENDMPCRAAPAKVCKNCESSTTECTTGKIFCYNVSWLRMMFVGPRVVAPMHTCAKHALRKGIIEKSR